MLIETKARISEIAAACGYPDANYFARVFTELESISLSEYRALHSTAK